LQFIDDPVCEFGNNMVCTLIWTQSDGLESYSTLHTSTQGTIILHTIPNHIMTMFGITGVT
jgi:hypothetical protein